MGEHVLRSSETRRDQYKKCPPESQRRAERCPDFETVCKVAYCADVGGGLTENEVVKCYAATVDGFPNNPNPNEVSEVAFMGLSELKRAIVKQPDQYAPWLKIYLGQIWDDLNEVSELCTKIDTQHRKSA